MTVDWDDHNNIIVGGDSPHIKGSELFLCAECGGRVWISPGGLEQMAQKLFVVVCGTCVAEHCPDEVIPITEKQIEELRASGVPQRMLDKIKRMTFAEVEAMYRQRGSNG